MSFYNPHSTTLYSWFIFLVHPSILLLILVVPLLLMLFDFSLINSLLFNLDTRFIDILVSLHYLPFYAFNLLWLVCYTIHTWFNILSTCGSCFVSLVRLLTLCRDNFSLRFQFQIDIYCLPMLVYIQFITFLSYAWMLIYIISLTSLFHLLLFCYAPQLSTAWLLPFQICLPYVMRAAALFR